MNQKFSLAQRVWALIDGVPTNIAIKGVNVSEAEATMPGDEIIYYFGSDINVSGGQVFATCAEAAAYKFELLKSGYEKGRMELNEFMFYSHLRNFLNKMCRDKFVFANLGYILEKNELTISDFLTDKTGIASAEDIRKFIIFSIEKLTGDARIANAKNLLLHAAKDIDDSFLPSDEYVEKVEEYFSATNGEDFATQFERVDAN